MTPAQMLARLNTEPKVCEVVEKPVPLGGPNDFATSAALSAYTCIKQKTCPVCGAKGYSEHYYGEYPASFFFCLATNNHTFEFDDDEGTADRINGWGSGSD